MTDPYLDPDTGILRNRLGVRTQHELDVVEGDLAWAGMLELLEYPPPATGDLDELRAIHRELFSDVYEWAGEVRTVDMRKNVEGAEFFLPASMIGRSAGYAADELRADNMLRGLDRERFVMRLAHHYDQFNTGGSAVSPEELFAAQATRTPDRPSSAQQRHRGRPWALAFRTAASSSRHPRPAQRSTVIVLGREAPFGAVLTI